VPCLLSPFRGKFVGGFGSYFAQSGSPSSKEYLSAKTMQATIIYFYIICKNTKLLLSK